MHDVNYVPIPARVLFVGVLLVFMYFIGAFVVRLRTDAMCKELGYAWGEVDWNFDAYCSVRVDPSEMNVPLDEVTPHA